VQQSDFRSGHLIFVSAKHYDLLSVRCAVWYLGTIVAEGHSAVCKELKFIPCLCKLSVEMLMFCRRKAISCLDMHPYPHYVHCFLVRLELYYERRPQNQFTVLYPYRGPGSSVGIGTG
jgi:hypothetical protein